VAISYMAAESGHQITECRKCIFRNLQSANRKPLLFQEIATSVSDKGEPLPETSSQ
jgi:Fe2+ or Zn2+ uptake regulation protein